jgi:predicted nucleotidyltransferase
MSIGHIDRDLVTRIPLDRVANACGRCGVAQLWIHGPILERDPTSEEDVEFLVEFLNNDAGPWGSKLDLLENDLSGVMHRKVLVSLRGGIRDSRPSPWREQILHSVRLIYEP